MNQERMGKFIQEKRKEKNMTQQDLAEKLGVSNRTISKWETGRCLPDYSLINDLCKELDITINELFQGKDIDEESYTIEVKRKKLKAYLNAVKRYLILIIVAYLFYRLYVFGFYGLLTKYPIDDDENSFPKHGNISNINVENKVMYNKEFDHNIRIFIPEEYVLTTDKAKSALVKEDCDLYTKELVGYDDFDSYILICNDYENSIYNIEEKLGINSNLLFSPNKILQEYNIDDQIDLIKYYEKHYNDKNNYFTPLNKIKLDYIAKMYKESTLSSYDKFYYLDGDLKGYMVNWNNQNYEIHFILGSNYSIEILSMKEKIDEEMVLNILNSIDRK